MQKQEDTAPTVTEEQQAKAKEALKKKLLALYATTAEKMGPKIEDYKWLMKHTGGLMSKSMSIAYQKGVSDTLQQLLKEIVEDEQKPNT